MLLSRNFNRAPRIAADRGAEPDPIAGGIARRPIEERAGLLRHPEHTFVEPRSDVFGSAAGKRQLEVMNDGRPIGGDRGHDTVADQIADDGTETDLKRMSPHQQDKWAIVPARTRNTTREFAQVLGREHRRQRSEKSTHRDAGFERLAELVARNLAREGRELARPRPRGINRSEFHRLGAR
jgi:hypothetical protein